VSEHTLAILVKAVGTAQAAKNLKGLDQTISNIGAHAGKGIRTATSNLLKLGAAGAAVGAGLLVVGIKNGVQSLAELETAVTSVDGAIAQMGLTGSISGQQIAGWANEIEAATGAAFDDKAITAATTNLIRYGKVGPQNLRQTMEVMTDLAVKTGSVESASSLLAKALSDPTKAAGRLTRAGIVLTAQQQKIITKLVKAGKLGEAQALILGTIEDKTKGAALASQGPYARALATMADATEDAQRALGEGFLPVIQRAADWLRTKMADPATIAALKNLGNNLANAFDEAITFAERIPWDSIGNGIKTAADFAGKLFDAFRSMPPEVQSTLIALAGLDALSGGAIHNIVGELGKGLIKGVLGMTAGVVHLKAGVVTGVGGGVPGTGGGGTTPVATGGSGGGLVSNGLKVAGALTIFAAGAELMFNGIPALARDLWGKGTGDEAGGMRGALGKSDSARSPITGFLEAQMGALVKVPPAQKDTTAAVDEVAKNQRDSTVALATVERSASTGLSNTTRAAQMAGVVGAVASAVSATRIVSAINSIPAPVTNVSISATTVTQSQTTQNRNGRTSSRVNDRQSGRERGIA
jgi:hypothetical protein